jgi:hypothetical protein
VKYIKKHHLIEGEGGKSNRDNRVLLGSLSSVDSHKIQVWNVSYCGYIIYNIDSVH